MNAVVEAPLLQAQCLDEQIATAVARVAPTWPLDQFIAVNPYRGWAGRPMPEAAAALGTLVGTRPTMSREWFRAQWAEGRLKRHHLQAAVAAEAAVDANDAQAQARMDARANELVAALQGRSVAPARLPLVTDLRDAGVPPQQGLGWSDLVTHQISQHCAAFIDRHQAACRGATNARRCAPGWPRCRTHRRA